MHKRTSCLCGCHGRRYLTQEEKKERLLYRKECLERELLGIDEAIEELEA